MKYIDIKSIIGNDERWWSMTGERKHLTGHMYYNSPFETDDFCGNCNGANCERCREVTDKAHWEFAVGTDSLEKAILEAAPELSIGEASELAYSDYVSSIVHNGETYKVEYPDESWLLENHPEIVEKLSEVWHIVEIDTQTKISNNHSKVTSKYYRFDSSKTAKAFLEKIYDLTKMKSPNFKEDFGDEYNRYLSYGGPVLESVSIFLREKTFGDLLRAYIWTTDIRYNDKIYHYKNGKLDSVTED